MNPKCHACGIAGMTPFFMTTTILGVESPGWQGVKTEAYKYMSSFHNTPDRMNRLPKCEVIFV